MNRIELGRLPQASSTNPAAALTRRLRGFAEPRARQGRLYFRKRVRSRVVRWLIELETTECPDQVWLAFEAWLAQRPERLEIFLAAERARQALDELCRGCPREGSQDADRLLRRLARQARSAPGCAVAPWLVLSLSATLGAALGVWWVL